MLETRQFRVDPRRVVHVTIDGETILIDLETGTYYSLRGSGSEIWGLLVDGWSEADTIAQLQHRYIADGEAIAKATSDLITELLDEGLLANAEANGQPVPRGTDGAAAQGPFQSPVLERFTDMQYFLLLDPIHEVEEGGWPQVAQSATPSAPSG